MAASEKMVIGVDADVRKALRELKQLEKMGAKVSKTLSGGFGGGGAGGAGGKVRALGTGLSAATVKADEFSKSLEASNARVVAFGASAGLIMGVERALKSMVASTVKVEKALMDVNVVMNASTKTLDQFGKGMFRVAKQTAQGFDTVAEAATELARQGLGMESTLGRTKDALILTRLTGMNAADAVKSLTAAINSFNKEGVTSAEIVNRMAKVDAAFAVSSEDLAKSVSRVGSSAVDAGVSLNQLMAITTSVQQKTARGGAVIGNAFKTIFTRIQRSDVQQKLRDIGVATTDMNGKMLDGVTVLQNLSRSFGQLNKAQQAQVGESVAGVFQINILKAAMSDLVNKNGEYTRALHVANSATNEAYVRNEQLNQTLDALANRTLANLTQAGSNIGGATLEPAIKKLLGGVNATIEAFGEGGAAEALGQTVGKGLMAGIGTFISGPGILLAGVAIGKLVANLAKFAGTAFKEFMGLNKATQSRLALQQSITDLLIKEPGLIDRVKSSESGLLTLERDILATIEAQTIARRKAAAIASPIAMRLDKRGVTTGPKGTSAPLGFTGLPGRAAGFIPNFASAGGERAAAAAGGYRAGAIRTMNQPGAGSMMYNSAETVKRFPGMTQSAIMPPQNSPAGAGYKSAFGAAHGFNPYAGSGFIPNFALTSNRAKLPETRGRKRAPLETSPALKNKQYQIDASEIGIILGFAGNKVKPLENFDSKTPGTLNGLKTKDSRLATALTKEKASVRLNGVRVKSFIDSPSQDTAENLFEQILSRELKQGIGDVAHNIITKFNIKGKELGKMGKLSPGLQGEVFEESMRMAMKAAVATPGADFDFEAGKAPSDDLQKVFGKPIDRIDAKRRIQSARKGEMPKKYFNDRMTGKEGITQIMAQRQAVLNPKSKKAWGFVPNFSALTSAMGREMSSGVPASAIRVGSSPALRSAGNPNGVGVYNTKHEPGGLNQGIGRSRAMGINPKTHGAAGGFVPNFTQFTGLPGEMKAAKDQKSAADENKKSSKKMGMSADKMMMASIALSMVSGGVGSAFGEKGQATAGALSSIASTALMGGSMGGPLGALGGAALGALMSSGDIKTMLGFNDAEIAAKEMKKVASELKESFTELKNSFEVLDKFESATPAQRIKALKDIDDAIKEIEGTKGNNPAARDLIKNARKDLNIDEVMRSGGAAGLPKGGLKELNNELVRITTEVLAANSRSSLGDVIKRLSTPFGAGMDKEGRVTSAADTKKMIDSFKGGYFTPELQSKLLGVKALDGKGVIPDQLGGIDILESIKKRVIPLGAGPLINKDGKDTAPGLVSDFQAQDFSKTIEAAADFANLLKRSKFATLGRELEKQVVIADAASRDPYLSKPGVASDAERGLQRLMFTLFNDPALSGLSNPRRVGAATLKPGQEGPSMLTTGELEFLKRGVRQNLMETSIGGGIRSRSLQGDLNAEMALRATNLNNRGRMSGITMAGDELITQKGELAGQAAENKAEKARRALQIKAEEKLNAQEVKMREGLIGTLDKQLGTNEAQAELLFKLHEQYKNVSEEDIIQRQRVLDDMQQGSAGLTTTQEAEKKFLENLRNVRVKSEMETDAAIKEVNKARDSEKTNIELNTKALIEQRKAMEQFQSSVEAFNIQSNARKTANRAVGLRFMEPFGIKGIGAREIAEADKTARRAAIREEGVSAANPGAAFREAFAYDDIAAVHDFEEGVVNVAETMQSSFASAFKSIASGAASAEEAFAGMAQGILDSISQMSFDMASKMMFKSMGFANGGLVKGYQSGGLVTGGSGHKDDVLTKMQGGEFVIRKSAVNKLGVGTLNAMNGIPGYASGGKAPGMGKMLAIGAGAAALGGVLKGGGQSAGPKPLPSQDYGFGRSKYGFLGGPDPDARGADRMSGGGGSASVSLNKAFVYYRRDPKTGALISEAARPTEGRFEVSDRLSLLGRLGQDDPQTARMFEKEQRMSKYQDYLTTETQRRKDAVNAVKRKKRGNLIQAYASAAMLIGGAKFMGGGGDAGYSGSGNEGFNFGADAAMAMPQFNQFQTGHAGSSRPVATGGGVGGGLARVMGGEYIMSPSAVRTHGVNVMSELNRGNLPGYAAGGLVGNQGGAAGTPAGGIGDTTNNVKININVDKSGGTEATAEATEQKSTGQERDDVQETEKNKELGKILQGVVLQEIVKQQRPGGLLQQTGQKTSR